MTRKLLEVNGVWKRLCRRPERALRYALSDIGQDLVGRPPRRELREGEFWALEDVSLSIEPGQVVGMIGHNGAGKSTLLNLVSGIMLPTTGSITLHTDRVAIIDSGGGLNPVETGRENAATQLSLHGVPEGRLADEIEAVERFAEIGDFIDAPVGTYSVGMRLRLAFSIYTRLAPDLFIVDEALGGGDLRFSNRFRAYLREFIDGGGAMLLCSHEMLAIQMFCHHCVLLDRGRVILAGDPLAAIDRYHSLMEEREAATRLEGIGDETIRAAPGRPHPIVDERCRVESVMVGTEDGGPVRPGGAVLIEVRLLATEEINDVACAIEIGHGEMVSIATLVGGYPADPFTLRPPGAVLRCRIERLPLAAGTYELRIGVSVPHQAATIALKGYSDAAVQMQVMAEVDPVASIMRARKNLVDVPSAWEVVAEQPTP